MKRELELRARKLLQEQRNSGKITKKQYENEINFIKKLKQERYDKSKTNNREVFIQMAQGWSSSVTTNSNYKLGRYEYR